MIWSYWYSLVYSKSICSILEADYITQMSRQSTLWSLSQWGHFLEARHLLIKKVKCLKMFVYDGQNCA